MRFSDAFREGYTLMKRNWQLVVIKLAVAIINIFLFLFLVLLPVIIAVIVTGIDLSSFAETADIRYSALFDQLTSYIALFAIGAIFFLVYLLIVTTIAIYIYGASSGIIANSVRDRSASFSSKAFFAEGKRLFGAFFRYITVYSFVIIPVIIGMVIITASAFFIVDTLHNVHETLSMFLGIFFVLSITAIFLFVLTASLAIFFYGSAYVIFKGEKSFDSIKKAGKYIYDRPSAYWLYCLLILCSLGITIAFLFIGIPLNLIPVIGPLFSIPYQIFVAIVQTYVGYFIISVIFLYFYRTEMVSGEPATVLNHTSPEPTPPQPLFPQE